MKCWWPEFYLVISQKMQFNDFILANFENKMADFIYM